MTRLVMLGKMHNNDRCWVANTGDRREALWLKRVSLDDMASLLIMVRL